MLTVAAGLPEQNEYPVDFIEAVSEVQTTFPLHPLQSRLERCIIFVDRGILYRELLRRVVIVAVTSRGFPGKPDKRLLKMRGYDEGTPVLSDIISCLRQG